ncbi:hypothetical protein BFW88_20750 [Pseudomonas fluorescens]|uniref:hypothetical protein n=1 Tax=Pseudomonas simiae TaxID=321846 RepID=UPI00099AB6C5|nr:hypothetical protein [Pseudomonas simiae]OPA87156.1 hypothetical protein BFW88_20750 [Pseudomonas fluorescens]OPB06730.1 hypothetical protein BFW92_20695 [Pseudomonas fluorescens]OPB18016.1 hypothetical protein BFW93_20725 [Pseudomonas fluorescens]WLG72720.1 hypothetical protein PSH60_21560 [Pseudomonas simiae]
MNKMSLPPLVGEIRDGKLTWQRLDNLNYELIGYFLSCHLIIEHYLDEYLKSQYSKLDWDSSRQSFGQKVSLLASDGYPEKYNSIPAIKHMNNLRNKLSHNIDFKIGSVELLPLSQYLKKACGPEYVESTQPKEILEMFTSLVCVWFASRISFNANQTK